MTVVSIERDRTGRWPRYGKWQLIVLDGKKMARLSCPGCGCQALLDHQIDEEGGVTPSVVCPELGCTFHEFVRLEGW